LTREDGRKNRVSRVEHERVLVSCFLLLDQAPVNSNQIAIEIAGKRLLGVDGSWLRQGSGTDPPEDRILNSVRIVAQGWKSHGIDYVARLELSVLTAEHGSPLDTFCDKYRVAQPGGNYRVDVYLVIKAGAGIVLEDVCQPLCREGKGIGGRRFDNSNRFQARRIDVDRDELAPLVENGTHRATNPHPRPDETAVVLPAAFGGHYFELQPAGRHQQSQHRVPDLGLSNGTFKRNPLAIFSTG
jgi:hypothetical protein